MDKNNSRNCIEWIGILEKVFSDNNYNGSGEDSFFIKKGIGKIMVSAPHAINHYRNGNIKLADMYTGGIALYLHEITGCHIICTSSFRYSDPNYDSIDINVYQQALRKYVEENKIAFVLDLHGAALNRNYAMEIGTAPNESDEADPSLHQYKYIVNNIRDIFEPRFLQLDNEKSEIWKNRIFDAGSQNTITKYITDNTRAAGLQLEINALYRNPANEKECSIFMEGLVELIKQLQIIEWE